MKHTRCLFYAKGWVLPDYTMGGGGAVGGQGHTLNKILLLGRYKDKIGLVVGH